MLSEAPHKGDYSVPCVIHELPLNKSDLCVTVALLKLEREFRRETNQRNGSFFVTLRRLSMESKCSTDSVRRSLARLEYMGLIHYWTGSWRNRRATEIKILLDNFYLADEVL